MLKVRKRFLFTILTLVAIVVIALVAVFFAKGYRVSPVTGTIAGTGILSVNSLPDQASVYLDGHLTSVTNGPINSLTPKVYDVKIIKEGYITWEKKIEVKEGLVTEVKATLFRTIPSIYPLTYSGAVKLTVSPDEQKIAYIVPISEELGSQATKKSGIWVWQMASERGLNLGRGEEHRQIVPADGVDYSQADFRWSPDSTQLLISFPDRHLLADIDRLNDPPRDITPLIESTLRQWKETESKTRLGKLQLIKDTNLRKTASSSAVLKWSPDETKILYNIDGTDQYKVTDLSLINKTYDLPKASSYRWLADSEHLVMTEYDQKEKDTKAQSDKVATQSGQLLGNPGFVSTKVSIIEIDGYNKSEIYFGSMDPDSIIAWPDGSRLAIISSLPTATASQPNLFGINLR